MSTPLLVRCTVTAVVIAGLSSSLSRAETPYAPVWSRQFGTSSNDLASSLAVDSAGNVVISGFTEGSLGGTNAGLRDAFVSKFDPAGGLLWSRQLGTSTVDGSYGVAVDGIGNVYISGRTSGTLGSMAFGGVDAFLTQYNPAGSLVWTQQLGTTTFDDSLSVSVDALGNAYVSGSTFGSLGGTNSGLSDAYLRKYDSSGNVAWTRQLGTSDDDGGYAVRFDGTGNTYVTGYTLGNLGGTNAGGQDMFLTKYDSSGNVAWSRQLGTEDDEWGSAISIDGSGNVYVSGSTYGDLGGANAGSRDAFIAKYSASGDWLWSKQLGTASDDSGDSLALDQSGNVFVGGFTQGSLGGPNAGGSDAYLTKYNAAGNVVWSQQFGTAEDDAAAAVSVSAAGDVLVGGLTLGDLFGTSAGDYDAFLIKFAAPGIAGDFDGDGDVDGADFVAWQTNYPAIGGATKAQGDADGDSDVDGADFAVWQNGFAQANPGSIPTPEPGSITLASTAILLGYSLRRRLKSTL